MLVVNGALEVEVGELFAQDIEKVELRAFDPPGRADGIVRKFCWFVGGVPALDDLVEARGQRRNQASLTMPPLAGAGVC